ncbi:MAG: hypothetical protein ACRDNZ_10340 [Streptosporangiaceae bacterium]
MEEVPARLQTLLGSVAKRCWKEPDLEDFLAWRGATLEYWAQMVFAAVAGRVTWAAQGETPLITACPSSSAKTSEKWADGALIWPDGAGALVEIKAVRTSQPRNMRAVASDLAALAAVDWQATLERPGPDAGVDDRWWQDRHGVIERWALSIALLHGRTPMASPETWVPDQLKAGIANLHRRFPERPDWVVRTEQALSQPFFKSKWAGERRSIVMLAWVALPTASNSGP